jgi:hypothetical protein
LEDLDSYFGFAKQPSRVDSWELDAKPKSLSDLDVEVSNKLRRYGRVAQVELLKFDAMAKRFIWAIDRDGSVRIAVEELATLPDGGDSVGHPRRRRFPIHPAQERKLGHPCLVEGAEARIAGELFMDLAKNGTLTWYVNVKSGRYCREQRPTAAQERNVLLLFREMIGKGVEFDGPDSE